MPAWHPLFTTVTAEGRQAYGVPANGRLVLMIFFGGVALVGISAVLNALISGMGLLRATGMNRSAVLRVDHCMRRLLDTAHPHARREIL